MTNAAAASEDLKVDITAHRASILPDLLTWDGENRKFYVTIIDAHSKRKRKKETKAIRSAGNAVVWDERLDALAVRPSSQITLTLYAKHRILPDIVIGTINIDLLSKTETSFTLATSFEQAPNIVLTIDVHGSHHSSHQEAILFLEPMIEGNNLPTTPVAPPLATQLDPDSQIVQNAQVASDNADNAVEAMNVCDEWKETVQNIQKVMEAVKNVADVHPYAEVAWTIISAIPEAFLAQFERDENIQVLVKSMRETFNLSQAEDLLKAIKPNSNQALILKVMLKHITICNDVIQRYAEDKEFSRRLFRNITGRISDEIKGLCDTLAKLRRDLLENAIINMQIAVHMIQKSMNILSAQMSNLDFDAKINDLPYKSGWSTTANKNGCLEGTRADFLEYILEWISNPSSQRGLILFGKLGTGKSSIAYEIALRFCFEERPGAYFSFSRAQKSKQTDKHTDHHLFTTIIRDMSDRYPSFKLALGQLITNNTPLRTSDDFEQLFSTLLLQPLETVKATDIPDLIVIDGLDESGDPEALAKFLALSLKRLPKNLRVLITSRSEGDIESCFRAIADPSYGITQMDDVTLAAKLEDDIRLYFRVNLTLELFANYGEQLIKKADGLFQWAAVACGHLKKRPAGYTEKDCLRGLLGREHGDKKFSQGLNANLYNLYNDVLSAHFTPDKWNIVRPRFCSVMGQLFGAFEPLSINTLTGLRRFVPGDDGDDGAVPAVVESMGSLLTNVTSGDQNLPVVPLHTSFRDFLTEGNNHDFSLNLITAHHDLTHACLDLMLDDRYGLKFNICELASSHLPNTKVGDLQSRIDKFISPPLFYASRFWDDHLECVPEFMESILGKLERFFSTKFLFWLEVLSVTNALPLAVQALTLVVKWLQKVVQPEVDDRVKKFIDVVTDAHTFLRSFGNIIAKSAPHIYVSALPFAPTSSAVYENYSPKFPSSLSFEQGQLAHWPTLEMSIAAPSDVKCIAFSPDGEWIASGLSDGTIRLWSATTAMPEGTPFIGHLSEVRSVEFSSNGQQLISGSLDCTIRLWNVATGKIEGKPWTGHEYAVNSVAFSPNEQYAVSGSGDGTIRIWSVAKGAIEGRPGTEHIGKVTSVAFSPDGKRIVSGSVDHTVRIWKLDLLGGVVELQALLSLKTGSEVRSVAFSPHGQRIAAGCFNSVIVVWDSFTDPSEGKQLKGHAYPVNSVKFSPDGEHIVSGSGDGKLFMWNTATKERQGSPLIGHTDRVRSCAFSPDGQRICSGGGDCYIHVWSVASAKRAKEERDHDGTGHIGSVKSVAFSGPTSEPHWVASGSNDHTVCLWNVEQERTKGRPLTGHTAGIRSIAFSPSGQQLISASADKTLILWNANTGTMEGGPFEGHAGAVQAVAFSPVEPLRVVSGSDDCTVRLWQWNTTTGTMEGSQLPVKLSSTVAVVNFSPDGRRVVTGSKDGRIHIWDVEKRDMERGPLFGHQSAVMFAAFLPDGEKIISCSVDKTCLWDANTGHMIKNFLSPMDVSDRFNTSPQSMSVSPDGSRIAFGLLDSTISVWNLTTGTTENLPPFTGHTGYVNSLAFSPDGNHIVSGSIDSTVRVWDVSGSKAISSAEHPSHVDVSKINNEGWICGDSGELLLWIQYIHRPTLQRPSHAVAVLASHHLRLDFSKFVHGPDWRTQYARK